MPTVAKPPDIPGTLPPPDVTPYSRRAAEYRRVYDQARAELGLPPEPWPGP